MKRLLQHARGTTFERTFVIGNGYDADDFDDIVFTVRKRWPASDVVDDEDVVGQVSVSGGGIVIDVTDRTLGTIEIGALTTKTWEVRVHVWDIKGVIERADPDEDRVYELDRGELPIVHDATRSLPITTP